MWGVCAGDGGVRGWDADPVAFERFRGLETDILRFFVELPSDAEPYSLSITPKH